MECATKRITLGTKEWASSNINIISGCSHDCRYCYARKMAIRFKRKTEETWKIMELNNEKLCLNFKKRKGRVMFPTSHDITPEFKEFKGGDYKMIGIYAKKARGLMSRYIIKNQLTDPEDIKSFNSEGYKYNKSQSKASKWVFTRKQ